MEPRTCRICGAHVRPDGTTIPHWAARNLALPVLLNILVGIILFTAGRQLFGHFG
jgi:hypothetical protein